MFRKINRVLRTAILITGAGVLLAKLAEKSRAWKEIIEKKMLFRKKNLMISGS